MNCIFVSDLHGNIKRFQKMFEMITDEKLDGVFIGGDILPNQFALEEEMGAFLEREFFSKIVEVKKAVNKKTHFFVIMGNDDPRLFEELFLDAEDKDIIEYVNEKTVTFGDFFVTGYCFVPPTPFQLKDWERYDVSRFVDVGAISPEEGIRSVDADKDLIRYSTISEDLDKLKKNSPLDRTILLFHSPPYDSALDRAALDGESIDHAPLDVHIGSIAIQRFIDREQPFLTLHGHVHESTSLTGKWREKKGKTFSFSAAHNGSELSVVRFDTDNLEKATRELIKV